MIKNTNKLILFVLLSICWIVSCNTIKQEQRKDDAAIDRATSKLPNLERVAEIVRKRFPCVTTETFRDTGKIIINEVKTQLPPVKIPFAVYKWKQISFDTIINGLSIYVDSNGIVISGSYICKEKTIPITTTIKDDELVGRQKDTINSLRIQKAAKDGVISEIRTNLSDQKKESNKWKWYFWLSIAGLIISHVLRSYIPGWINKVGGMFKKS